MKIAASLVVTKASPDEFTVIELDTILNGLPDINMVLFNAYVRIFGVTWALNKFGLTEDDLDMSSFVPGSDVYIVVQHSAKVRIAWIRATHGDDPREQANGAVREKIDEILWTDASDEKALSYIPEGGLDVDWFGNEATGLKRDSTERGVEISALSRPAISKITYEARYRLFKFKAPNVDLDDVPLSSDGSYPIQIVLETEYDE